jgi:hypothetical protein
MYDGGVLSLRLGLPGIFGKDNDSVDIDGRAVLDGQLLLSGTNLTAGETYTIITADDGVSGAFDIPQGGLFAGNTPLQIQYLANSVRVTVIPEPLLATLLPLSSALLAVRMRRRG